MSIFGSSASCPAGYYTEVEVFKAAYEQGLRFLQKTYEAPKVIELIRKTEDLVNVEIPEGITSFLIFTTDIGGLAAAQVTEAPLLNSCSAHFYMFIGTGFEKLILDVLK